MSFSWLSKARAKNIAIYSAVSLVLAVVLFNTVGTVWAFFGLFALWISGHMVAWFNRHPPPPHKFDD